MMDSLSLWPVTLGLAAAALAICLIVGITARWSRARLRRQNILLDAALNNMTQGLNMFDSAGRLVLFNARYAEMYGLARGKVRPGITVRDLVELRLAAGTFFETDPEQYSAELMSSMAERRPTRTTRKVADGRVVTVVNQPMAEGGWVVTHEDVTERWRAERALESTRNFLDTVIENVPAAILVKDARDLSYVLINREGERFFGIPRAQAIGKKANELFASDIAEKFTAHDRQSLESRSKLFLDQHPVTTPDNVRRILTTTRVPIMDEANEPKYLLTVVQDVTERWRAERALESTRNFLDTVIENVPAAIVVKDARDFRYVLMNREGERLYGIAREQAIGKTAQDIFPESAGAMIARHDQELLEHGGKQLFDEHPMRVPGAAARIVLTTRLPIMDEDNKPKYLLTVIQDVTERKRAEARIARLAHYDLLTDLPNRAAFNECFASVLDRAAECGRQLRGAVRRSRPLQGGQRRVRSFGRRSPAARGCRAHERDARGRLPRPHRRRRIRRHRHREPGCRARPRASPSACSPPWRRISRSRDSACASD